MTQHVCVCGSPHRYLARVMRYDPDTGRHDLLYDLDQQTESVRLESEPIMFGAISNLVWVQVKHFPRWPAVVVDINAKTIASDASTTQIEEGGVHLFLRHGGAHLGQAGGHRADQLSRRGRW